MKMGRSAHSKLFAIIIYSLGLMIAPGRCLVLKNVSVPTLNIAGDSAMLFCDYDPEGDQIYSVKWYKGGREIFRTMPSSHNTITVYPKVGVNIDKAASNNSVMVLRNLSLATTGRYRCEVSSEAPTFSTKSGYGDLLVLVLPSSPPIIQGGKGEYRPGDIVHLNCTSRDSKPAADLTWFINNKEVDGSYVIPHPITTSRGSGLHTSTSSIFLTLGENHFTAEGDISISCTASIKLVNWADKTISD